jgi:hypothetical protein
MGGYPLSRVCSSCCLVSSIQLFARIVESFHILTCQNYFAWFLDGHYISRITSWCHSCSEHLSIGKTRGNYLPVVGGFRANTASRNVRHVSSNAQHPSHRRTFCVFTILSFSPQSKSALSNRQLPKTWIQYVLEGRDILAAFANWRVSG